MLNTLDSPPVLTEPIFSATGPKLHTQNKHEYIITTTRAVYMIQITQNKTGASEITTEVSESMYVLLCMGKCPYKIICCSEKHL